MHLIKHKMHMLQLFTIQNIKSGVANVNLFGCSQIYPMINSDY